MLISLKTKTVFSTCFIISVLLCSMVAARAEGLKVIRIRPDGVMGSASTEMNAGESMKLGLVFDSNEAATVSVKWNVTDAAGNDRTEETLDDATANTPALRPERGGEVLFVKAEAARDSGMKYGAGFFVAVNSQENSVPRAAISIRAGAADGESAKVNFKCDSFDKDGDEVSYCWDFDAADGIDPGACDSTEMEAGKTLAGGVVEITCIVTDGKGGVGFDRRTFDPERALRGAEVAGNNQPPEITSFSLDFSRTEKENKVFLVAQTNDPDGDALDIEWRANAGELENGGSPIACWNLPENQGSLSVVLSVSDGTAPAQEREVRFTVEPDEAETGPVKKTGNSMIRVGVLPRSITADPSGNRVYVANYGSDDVSIIDAVTEKVLRTVDTDRLPMGMTFDDIDGKVFIANTGYVTISAFNADGSGSENINPGLSESPLDVAVDSVNDVLYVLLGGMQNGKVVMVSSMSGAAGVEIPVGANPVAMTFNRQTRMLYVADAAGKKITVIDGWKNEVVASVMLDSAPADIEVNEKTNRVYASCPDTGTLAVIDGNSNTMAYRINIGFSDPKGVGVDEDRNLVFVANGFSETVSVVDGARNIKLKDIPVGADLWDVVAVPKLHKLFVTMRSGGAVAVVEGY